jgi:hypothetical protein
MTDDRGLAALAAALAAGDRLDFVWGRFDKAAVAVLGERAVFLPDGLPHDCETSIRLNQSMTATIATLRAELATAQEVRTTASDREADAVHLIDDIRRLIAEYDRG